MLWVSKSSLATLHMDLPSKGLLSAFVKFTVPWTRHGRINAVFKGYNMFKLSKTNPLYCHKRQKRIKCDQVNTNFPNLGLQMFSSLYDPRAAGTRDRGLGCRMDCNRAQGRCYKVVVSHSKSVDFIEFRFHKSAVSPTWPKTVCICFHKISVSIPSRKRHLLLYPIHCT